MTQVNNYVDWEFTNVESIKEPERYLRHSKELLDQLSVKWWFSFGTALGLYRDNGFVQQDTDVDISVVTDDPNKVIDLFAKHYSHFRLVTEDGIPQQACFMGDDGYFIDICFFYLNNDKLVSYCEGGRWEDRPEIIGNLRDLKTQYGTFPVPEHIEDYLTDRYGDWQTPRYGEITSSIKA
jgi:phosphorylcholine metabolism protein LicD